MIQNKVAESELVTLDLKAYLPQEEPALFDLKNFLFRELILKEKEFRSALLTHDWEQYKGRTVLIFCSADAIIPIWAYMLVVVYLNGVAADLAFVNKDTWITQKTISSIEQIDVSPYQDKRVVIKGCGEEKIPEAAFVMITQKLLPVVKSIMYGEPCSTVPIYKKK
ncbi:MAG: DUF2480 family protein [Bacteroidota bacterium]|jgi:hypothetical protein